MKSSVTKFFSFLLPLSVFFHPAFVMAQTTEIACPGKPDTINTALGCISVANGGQDFIARIIQLSIALGGAIALLLMLYGFYVLTTSAGMPDKVKSGQQIITSAVSGLLFIILSAVVLNLLGVQVLGLPGF